MCVLMFNFQEVRKFKIFSLNTKIWILVFTIYSYIVYMDIFDFLFLTFELAQILFYAYMIKYTYLGY